MLIWITGLPGSGKSTLANELQGVLSKKGIPCVSLDGEALSSILPCEVGFSLSDRERISLFYAHLASAIESTDVFVICSFVSMFEVPRKIAKDLSTSYFEVFIDPPIAKLIEFNKKSLYKSSSEESVASQVSSFQFPATSDYVINEVVDIFNSKPHGCAVLSKIGV